MELSPKYPIMKWSKILLVFSLYFFGNSMMSAQICFDSYNNERCPYRIVSEFAISTQLNPLYDLDRNTDLALNLGLQKGIDNDLSIGIHWFSNLILGGDNSSFQMGVRPRIAYKLSEDFEASISPGVIITNSIDGLDQFKGISLETNISWKNNVGIVLRFDNHNSITRENDTVINLGLQTHGSTSFYSIGGVFLGGAILAILGGGFEFF